MNAWRHFAAVASFASLLLTASGPLDAQRAPVTIGVAGRLNEHVSAASEGSSVALAWAAAASSGQTDIVVTVSSDAGASFGPPVRVNAVDGQAHITAEQPPRVAFVKQANERSHLVVVWTAKAPSGTVLLSARSVDSGRTFGPSAVMPGTEAAGNRGWHSVAAAADGRLHALWLDHRDTAAARTSQGAHQHGAATRRSPADAVAQAQRSQLFVSSGDGPGRAVTRGVCYCCNTALAVGPDGTVYGAWRHVYDGNQRDIAFTVSRDGGRSFAAPVRVSEDAWQIDGCPENGPALAVDGPRIHVVWPTLVRANGGETLKLFLASTSDGHRFTPRTALPTNGAAYRPQAVVTPDRALVVVWEEFADGERHVKFARGRVGAGNPTQWQVRMLSEGAASSPALAITPSHTVAAWTSRANGRAMIAVARVPHESSSAGSARW